MITNLGLFFINYNCKAISLHLVMMPDPMQLTIRNFYLSSIPAGILIRLLGPVLCLFFSVFISIGQPVSTDRAREVSEYTDTLGRTDTTHNDLLADLFDNDTVIVTYMRYGDLFTLLPFEDSLLSLSLRQMDVARSQNVEYFTLGNIGSPAYSPLVRPVTRGAFDMGNHGYDLYRITFDNFRFYRPATPYSHVRYGTTTGIRDDNIFTGKLSRNFAKKLTVNVDYSRFNQVGEFLRDRMRNTTFGVGFEQSHWNGRYKTHLIYIYNQFLRDENGGVAEYLTDITGISGKRLSMPVNISNGGSRYREWGVLLNNDLTLLRSRDSLSASSGKGLHIGYEVSYHRTAHTFYDTDVRTKEDSTYYRLFNTDIRGIRNSYIHQVFLNRAYISAEGKTPTTTGVTSDYLRGGIALERNFLTYLPTDSAFTLLKLEGAGHWNLARIAGVSAKGYYLLSSLTPVFDVEGTLSGKLIKWLHARAWIRLSNLPPSYIFNHLNLNSSRIFHAEAKNIFRTYFGGAVNLPGIGLELSLHQNIVTNHTFFDNDWRMQQTAKAISVTGIQAQYNLKAGPFHLDNSVLWQASTDKDIRVPGLAGSHAAYWEASLLKRRLLINIGAEVRYLTAFDRIGYSPLLFSFYNTDAGFQSSMLTYDAFISYKIRLLRGFIRADNINSLYDNSAQYQIAPYPIDAFAIRIGFDWIFNN